MIKIKKILNNEFNEDYSGIHMALDIGTGSGLMSLTLADLGIKCITVDKSNTASERAKDNIQQSVLENKPLFMQMDARNLSFLDDSFDLITAYRSLHHIKNASQSLTEMYRVCKPGGKILIVEHNEHIRNAIDFLNKIKGNKHPHEISLNEIWKKLEGFGCQVKSMNTEVGTVLLANKPEQLVSESGNCQFTQYEVKDRGRRKVYIGQFENKEFYYNMDKHCFLAVNTEDIEDEVEINLKKEKSSSINQDIATSLCLNIANKCNLRCKYCYADGGNYGNDEALMSEETAYNSILWYRNFLGTDKFHIIFFGGEPLLQWNTIKNTVDRLKESNWNNVTYSLNTNGTLLNRDIVKECMDNRIKVAVSIDGDKDIHDNMRFYSNGKPTYDIIMKNLEELNDFERESLWIRITMTRYTRDLYDDVMQLIDLGFKKFDMSFVTGNYDLSETAENIEDLEKSFDRLSKFALEQWVNGSILIYPFVKVFEAVLFGRNPAHTCTAGREMLSVQPDGNLVPCFRFSDIMLGNIDSKLNNQIYQDFEAHKEIQRYLMCDECWATMVCGGFCPKDIETMIKIQPIRCHLTKHIIARSLYHLGVLWFEKPQIINNINRRLEAASLLDKIKNKKEEKMI